MNDNSHNQVFRPSSVEGNATVIHRSDLLFNRLLSVQKSKQTKSSQCLIVHNQQGNNTNRVKVKWDNKEKQEILNHLKTDILVKN